MPIYTVAPVGTDDGSSWQNGRKLARAPNGTLWAAYWSALGARSDIRAAYSIDDGATWTEEIVAQDPLADLRYPSLAVDILGYPHIVYEDDTNSRTYYTQRTINWSVPLLLDTGENPCIAIDSMGNPHVIYSIPGITYISYSGGAWNPPEVVATTPPGPWFGQHYPQLAIDRSDNIHVVWEGGGWGLNPGVYSIQYRQKDSTLGWQPQEEVCNLPASQWRVSLCIDSADDVHAVWFPTGGGISYRARITGVWGVQENPVVGGGNFDLNITIDRSDNLYVTSSNNSGAIDHCRYIVRTAASDWIGLITFTPNVINDYYQASMFAIHPISGGISSNIPAAGFYCLYSSDSDDVMFFHLVAPALTDIMLVAAQDDDALTLIDISNPANPIFVGSVIGAGAPHWLAGASNVVVVDRYAYVAAPFDNALTIVDIYNPLVPVVVGSLQGAGPPNWLGGASDVKVRGIYAFVTAPDDNSLTIINVSNPTAPAFVAHIDGAGAPNWLGEAYNIFIKDNYAYVAAIVDASLTIIDISNPLAPAFIGHIAGVGAPKFLSSASAVFVLGNYAYVAAPDDNSLTIIDITNPAAPTFASHIDGIGAPNWLQTAINVFISGGYAYVSALDDDSLTIINNSNPLVPTFASHIDGAGAPNWLDAPCCAVVRGSYAYVASYDDDSLTIIDISNPLAPAFTANIHGGGALPWLGGAHGLFNPVASIPAIVVPVVATYPAQNVLRYNAELHGALIDDGGSPCSVGFEWGTDESSLGSSQIVGTGVSSSTTPFALMLNSLLPKTTYYFRAFATNIIGTGYGAILSFTTQDKLTPIVPPINFIDIGLVIGAGLGLVLFSSEGKRVLDTWTGKVYKSWKECAKDVLTPEDLRKAWYVGYKAKLTKMYPGRFVEIEEEQEPWKKKVKRR